MNGNHIYIYIYIQLPDGDNCADSVEQTCFRRASKDGIVNDFERYLLNLCGQFDLVILFFLPGTGSGDFTYGASVIDHFIMSSCIVYLGLYLVLSLGLFIYIFIEDV